MKTVKAVPLTPTLLREEAKKAQKYMREPGVGPWVLEWVASLMDVVPINLRLDCPQCGRECGPCTGVLPAYNADGGTFLRVAIVNYMCRDCPHVWAHWQNVPEEEGGKSDHNKTDGNKSVG